MKAIIKRELSSYLTSAGGYVFLAIYWLMSGFMFYITLVYGVAELSSVFGMLNILSLLLLPILTMKLWSEEKKQKTDQLLLTAPINLFSLVFAKFMSAFILYAIANAITLVYALILSFFAAPDWAVFLGNIVGILLLGAAILSIGVFVSSMTESQVVAAIISWAASILLYLTDLFVGSIPVQALARFVNGLSFTARYTPFTAGIFDFSNVVFFVSVVAVFLFLTIRILDKKRWS